MKNLQMCMFLLICLLVLASCGSKNEGTEAAQEEIADNPMSEEAIVKIKLNDDLMKKYINAIKVLKEKGQEIDNNANAISSLYQYSQIESLVKETGFKNINEFVAVHTKVVWSMVSFQSGEEIKNIDYDKAKSESEKSLEEALKDPNLTEEAKKQLEQARELMNSSLSQSKNSMQQYLEQIKKYATEEDVAIVKHYMEDLKKVYEME
ncbi:hypothetical protein [Thermoflexibacter ruber]|uniref:Lipoprotein n=1 Tax=Thermoflexibacter ruber TaxID=1003 RepID=A0A1I2AD41_9BACT|nr:hypothetical protein [Thermoflexibacter ruber]SFE40893.1 hypothetical protein SAMN04488541_100192 [Thermoflexibacter ruber]